MHASQTRDDRLAAYLAASTGAEAEQALGEVLERHAAPLVRRIVSRRLSNTPSDIDDVCAKVILQLMVRLRRERTEGAADAIGAFDSYVAVAAQHGCDHHIRAQYPLRWQLRNRIRYVLEHDARFSLWKIGATWVCGSRGWRGRAVTPDALPDSPLRGVAADDVAGLLEQLFPPGGHPLELAVVVERAADAWGIPLRQYDDGAHLDVLAHDEPRIDQRLDQRARLTVVWDELRTLPGRQRHAVLLNLRDDAITLFLTSGVTTMQGIADVLELTLDGFAAIWNDLPLPDNTIAARLACTRQQVINLRMAARRRLANRLAPKSNMRDGRTL